MAKLGGADPTVDLEIAKYKQLVSREEELQSRLASGSRAQDLLSKLTEARRQLPNLAGALQPFGALIVELRAAVRAKDQAKAADLERELEALMRKKNYDQDRLKDEFGKLDALYGETEQWSKALSKLIVPFNNAHQNTVDQFCIAANALREQGEVHNLSFPAVESFFGDENLRIKKLAESVIDKADLAERDRAMNANAQEFFRSSGKKSVAMIVGYAHLESAAEGLKAAGISFIAGTLPSINDDLEPWEEPAWEKRHEPIQSIFSSSNKDQTRFQDPKWKPEETAKVSFFLNLPDVATIPQGSARYFDGVGGNPDRVVRVGDIFVDRSAETGEHVLEQGVAPGGARNYYQVYDRKVAASEVTQLSDSGTAFSYFFKATKGDNGSGYQFRVPGGTVDLAGFIASPPRRSGRLPKRVVLFGEPDDVKEAGSSVSPLWKALRTGGGGAGEPPNRGWATAFAEPEDKGNVNNPRTELLRTINARRAKEKLAILDHQDPLRFNQIQFVEDGKMEKLWFTPRAGDRSQVVVFLGKNDPRFRENLRRAAVEGKLKNKQVALISCGDAFAETAALRELLLREGALMVWVPDRQITPEAGMQLKNEIANTFAAGTVKRPRTIQGVMERGLSNWKSRVPDDPDVKSFEQNGTWVFVLSHRTRVAG